MRLRGTETVLAVDDDPIILDIVQEVLQPLGYKVLSAASGEDALVLADSYRDAIDLLLTDVVLPGIMGQELAMQVLHVCPGIHILFMSGYLCPSMAHKNSKLGFEGFIQKPFSPNALLRKMRKILD